ncbi:hypothetical protein A0H81_09198 [Grifola frondosa]|uniref:Uncharacterized protein n=1 Tax=Grifola frondosa TaxID=5627 RepID=A0A1C7M183_GRIFR|nr:hypothetical protein A0H81_09198 [Grifola frondosa]
MYLVAVSSLLGLRPSHTAAESKTTKMNFTVFRKFALLTVAEMLLQRPDYTDSSWHHSTYRDNRSTC